MAGVISHTLDIGGGVALHYREKGRGRPVLFVHSVWGSARFFEGQVERFGEDYRAIALDLRGHGRSTMTPAGHTVPGYARDLRAILERLDLEDVVVVGWSMGSFVLWDYYSQFGAARIKGAVVVDQSATDFRFDDFPLGMITFDLLRGWMIQVQDDRDALVREIIPLMFAGALSKADFAWIFEEMTRAPEAVAGAILFDQSLRDYRAVIEGFPIPTLVCFGADETLQSVEAGRQIEAAMQHARLEIFEHSGHCPFLEEPDRFNEAVERFVRGLG